MKGVQEMEELISFELVPSSLRECYVVENLKFNRHLVGFSGEKEIDGAKYEIKVYNHSVAAYTNKGKGNTFNTIFNAENCEMVHENVIDNIKDILNLFKLEMQEHIDRKVEWERKSTIHISI